MRSVHLIIGLLFLVVFLLTGQFMEHHTPLMTSLPDGTRLLYRSRHIYILASAVANTLLGLYLTASNPGWRRLAQHSGSALFLLAPFLLTAAFMIEPGRKVDAAPGNAAYGLFALFLGTMVHLLSRIPQRATHKAS